MRSKREPENSAALFYSEWRLRLLGAVVSAAQPQQIKWKKAGPSVRLLSPTPICLFLFLFLADLFQFAAPNSS